jgi:hypothetical protein
VSGSVIGDKQQDTRCCSIAEKSLEGWSHGESQTTYKVGNIAYYIGNCKEEVSRYV